MNYVLTCDNCECRCIEMIEQNGDLMAKGIGEIYVGTVVLELSNNVNDNKISSKDTEDICTKSTKKGFFLSSDEEVCHFDFNESAQKNGEKVIKMQVQSDSSATHYIFTQTSHTTSGNKALINAGWDTNQLISCVFTAFVILMASVLTPSIKMLTRLDRAVHSSMSCMSSQHT